MIIQVLDSASKRWVNRCQCPEPEVEKEIAALKRIYRFNEFRTIEGDTKLPGPLYVNKTTAQIDNIVEGIDWLMKQPKDSNYPNKVMGVMQGRFIRGK